MSTQFLNIEKMKAFKCQLKCIAVFIALMTSYGAIGYFLTVNDFTLGVILFVGGWLFWTFVEYVVHRFWMHDTPLPQVKAISDYHMVHHRQPTEMDITTFHRFLVWV